MSDLCEDGGASFPNFLKTHSEEGHLLHLPGADFFPSSSLFCVCQFFSIYSRMKIQGFSVCDCKPVGDTQVKGFP